MENELPVEETTEVTPLNEGVPEVAEEVIAEALAEVGEVTE